MPGTHRRGASTAASSCPTHWLISTRVLYLPNIRPEKLGAASLIAVHRLVAGLPLRQLGSTRATRRLGAGTTKPPSSGRGSASKWRRAGLLARQNSATPRATRFSNTKQQGARGDGPRRRPYKFAPRAAPRRAPADAGTSPEAILATEELRFNGGWSSTPLGARGRVLLPEHSHARLHTHAQSARPCAPRRSSSARPARFR